MPHCVRASITRQALDELIGGCYSRLPYEACGILMGASDGGELKADAAVFIRNVSPHPERSFRFDPQDWIRISYEAQKNQRMIVGFFHSHPNGPSAPSRQDGEGWEGSAALWIVNLADRPGGSVVVYTRGSADAAPQWQVVPLSVACDQ